HGRPAGRAAQQEGEGDRMPQHITAVYDEIRRYEIHVAVGLAVPAAALAVRRLLRRRRER
ncbi:hypothetical protein ACWEN3_31685, partial [Streptomyces sp. NPDC004561]